MTDFDPFKFVRTLNFHTALGFHKVIQHFEITSQAFALIHLTYTLTLLLLVILQHHDTTYEMLSPLPSK